MSTSGWLRPRIDNIPDDLRECARWGHWVDTIKKNDRVITSKYPISTTSPHLIRVNEPGDWTTFDEAVQHFRQREGKVAGLAFLLHSDDGFVGIDVDDCIGPNGVKPWAQPILNKFDSYWEISPSGTGVKGFIRAQLPKNVSCTYPIGDGRVELYGTNRFFAITGHIIDGAPQQVEQCQSELDWLLQHLGASPARDASQDSEDCHEWPPTDLNEITNKCAWLRHCRDDAETLSEAEWYAMLSIVGRCKDGQRLAHEWSRPHGGYSEAETAAKLQHAIRSAGPTLCETVAGKLSQERFCNGCVHRAKASSPITAGQRPASSSFTQIENGVASPNSTKPTLDEPALYGVAGEFVRLVEPHSEAGRASLLFQFLAAAGVYLGKDAYYQVESDRHFVNLFVCVVGDTSKGRKGTSWGRVHAVVKNCDPVWESKRVLTGLSSGEGFVWAIRDPIKEWKQTKGKTSAYEEVIVDQGEDDKRLLVYEPEFARVLQVMQRQSNTLSATLRQAWDGAKLQTLVKKQAANCLDPHVAIIGHITREELVKTLSEVESANGFANRFLFCYAERSKLLPFGGELQDSDLEPIAQRLKMARDFADTWLQRMAFDDQARQTWVNVYPELSAGHPGLYGAITARAEAQVIRLAALYAVLDQSKAISQEHLLAALAAWKYSEDSARLIFGDALGDATADSIRQYLMTTGAGGATRTDISNFFRKHKAASEIERALNVLLQRGLARFERESTDGRSVERWFAVL